MRVGIVGYGNLGKSLEKILISEKGHELYGIFTRRIEESIGAKTDRVYPYAKILEHAKKMDAVFISVGSYGDAFDITPSVLRHINTVDSFDNHNRSREYLSKLDEVAKKYQRAAISCAGWDPGLFSILRLLLSSIFSSEKTYTYWGRGISQGHSAAVRKIDGVRRAACYTVPDEKSVLLAKMGVSFDKTGLHHRECFVVADGDQEKIAEKIKSMPDYFLGTETHVYFISEGEFLKNHSKIYHRGRVISSDGASATARFELDIKSNPDLTARVMISMLSPLSRLIELGDYGAKTVFDFPLSFFSRSIYEYL